MGVTGVNYQLISFPHVSARRRQFACSSLLLWAREDTAKLRGGLNQAIISRTDCLFFHRLCPSDKQDRAATYDPFH